MDAARTIYNPYQKDYVTFLQTVNESNGKQTVVDVSMAAGGGNGIHYHKTYEERFECLEGELKVQTGKIVHVLKPGDVIVAKPYDLHRFFNDSEASCRFRVTISPGCRGFEETLQIAYGLARDGRVNKKGMPAKLDHMAILLSLSESSLPGWQSILEKGLRWVGKKAEKRGVVDQLRAQYVTI
jgi:quercetin dioxygenase-like cupin family protein